MSWTYCPCVIPGVSLCSHHAKEYAVLMSLTPLARDEDFNRLTEEFAHLAPSSLRESGELFVRLPSDLCPYVLKVFSQVLLHAKNESQNVAATVWWLRHLGDSLHRDAEIAAGLISVTPARRQLTTCTSGSAARTNLDATSGTTWKWKYSGLSLVWCTSFYAADSETDVTGGT